MNIYATKRFWFKTLLGLFAVTSLGLEGFFYPKQAEAYQDPSTPTGAFVTVTYTDPINVRSGPSTVYYPIIGQLFPGDIAPALGVSPGREWIQISYPGVASGVGWVYSSFVAVSGNELRIVEPPPTPAPLTTATIDPTLAAAFNVQPTSTRLPTFTPPPLLETKILDPDPASGVSSGVASGVFIFSLGTIGLIGLLLSFVLRKQ